MTDASTIGMLERSATIRRLWACRVPIALALVGIGVAMMVLAGVARGEPSRRIIELVVAAAVLGPGLALLALARRNSRSSRLHFAAGEIAVDGAFFYLAAAAPTFIAPTSAPRLRWRSSWS